MFPPAVPGCQVVPVRAGNQVKLISVHPFQPCGGICEFIARSLARGLYSTKNWLQSPDFSVIGSRQSRQVSTEELRVPTGPQN